MEVEINGKNLDDLIIEFKAIAECRALIIMNGMKLPVTPDNFFKAGVICATRDVEMTAAMDADWRLVRINIDDGDLTPTPHLTLPSWLVDGIQQFVTEDELDTIIGETPCKQWLTGLVEYAKQVPAGMLGPKTLEICQFLQDAADTLPPEIEEQINASLKLKMELVREARKQPPKDEPEIAVAIIGLD